MSSGVPTAIATRNARPVETKLPTYGNEPEDEGEDRQWQGKGQAQQDHDQVLRDGPEERHAAGADHVPAEHVDRAAGRGVDLFQAIAVEPLADVSPEALPVEQEVEAQQP